MTPTNTPTDPSPTATELSEEVGEEVVVVSSLPDTGTGGSTPGGGAPAAFLALGLGAIAAGTLLILLPRLRRRAPR